MAYFDNFPYVNYEFPDGVQRFYKNISIRPAVVDMFFDERSNFEAYTISDGETPETIAFDIFGDVNLHWTIMLPNNILSLYRDWPKTTSQFDDYLIGKYRNSDSDTVQEIREYVEFAGSTANNFQTTVGEGVRERVARPHHFEDANKISYSYDQIVNNESATDAFGRSITIPTVAPVSIYEYENELNEAKRVIVVPQFAVAQRMKAQLLNLVNG